MINVLKRLAELDSQNPNVTTAKPKMSADAAVEAVQKTLSEELSVESLRYLSGVKQTLDECGMYPEGMGMSSSAPSTPASFSINATAADGDEVANMLSQIMTLAGAGKVGPGHMPVDKAPNVMTTLPSLSQANQSGNDEMKRMIDMMNEPEAEAYLSEPLVLKPDPSAPPPSTPAPPPAPPATPAPPSAPVDAPEEEGVGQPEITTMPNGRVRATYPAPTAPSAPDQSSLPLPINSPDDRVGGPKTLTVPTTSADAPEKEGIGGGLFGAIGGGMLGGPLGAMAGYAAGSKAGDDISDEGVGAIPEVDIAGVGGGLAAAAMSDGDPNEIAAGVKAGKKVTADAEGGEMEAKDHIRKMMDMLDNSPNNPTDVPAHDPDKFAYNPNGGGMGIGDRMDGTMPKGNMTAEDTMTSKLFSDYQKFVTEGEKQMSRAAKGWKKYGDGMIELSKAAKKGASEKKMDAIRDKHDKYN